MSLTWDCVDNGIKNVANSKEGEPLARGLIGDMRRAYRNWRERGERAPDFIRKLDNGLVEWSWNLPIGLFVCLTFEGSGMATRRVEFNDIDSVSRLTSSATINLEEIL